MYEFVNQHLKLGIDEPIADRKYRRLSREELSVWNNEHPQPVGDPRFESQLLEQINGSAQ